MTRKKFGPYAYGPYAAPTCMTWDDMIDPENAFEAACWDWIEENVTDYHWGWLKTRLPGYRHKTAWSTIWFQSRSEALRYREAWAERLWDGGSSDQYAPPPVIDRDGQYDVG